MGRRVVRVTLEIDLVEGDDFNSIGAEEDPPVWGTDEQIRFWAKNYFVDEFIPNHLDHEKYGLEDIREFIQTKIVEEPN